MLCWGSTNAQSLHIAEPSAQQSSRAISLANTAPMDKPSPTNVRRYSLWRNPPPQKKKEQKRASQSASEVSFLPCIYIFSAAQSVPAKKQGVHAFMLS